MAHILIVEDEKSINDLIAMSLALVGHTSQQVYEGNEALESLNQNTYSLIIMDIMLPGLDGFTMMQYVSKDTPVIFLTAMGNLSDKIKGLNLGADDYIVKPFETIELLARIDAVLRRTHRSLNTFSLDVTFINLESRVVTVNGSEIELTLREYELLEILIKNKNIALSREKLRKKLNWENRIKTVYKMGYRPSIRRICKFLRPKL